ncbi:MAG: hypothetical protein ACPIOQ_80475, partial [Promethearchaeia archaeon]
MLSRDKAARCRLTLVHHVPSTSRCHTRGRLTRPHRESRSPARRGLSACVAACAHGLGKMVDYKALTATDFMEGR